MKRGYKHATTTFGDGGELYCSRLFLMAVHPNKDRMPDLVTVRGVHKPRIAIEVKSGRKEKGVMCDYQISYGVSSAQDYRELFGVDPPGHGSNNGRFRLDAEASPLALGSEKILYYVNLLNRVDELRASDLDRPFSTVRFEYGNQFLIPGDLAEVAFMTSLFNRLRKRGGKAGFKKLEMELLTHVKKSVDEQSSLYREREQNRDSWQDIHARDMRAIFFDDMELATEEGRERIKIMKNHYDFRSLKRVRIKGPNDTMIYVFAKKGHGAFFDRFKRVVGERVPVIERVAEERARSLGVLEGIRHGRKHEQHSLFSRVDLEEKDKSAVAEEIGWEEVRRLDRLINWLDEGEQPLVYFDPAPF